MWNELPAHEFAPSQWRVNFFSARDVAHTAALRITDMSLCLYAADLPTVQVAMRLPQYNDYITCL